MYVVTVLYTRRRRTVWFAVDKLFDCADVMEPDCKIADRSCFCGMTLRRNATLVRAQQLLRWATVWPHHNRHGPKSGTGCCSPFRRGAESPSNTMSPGPRPTSVPSGILSHQPFGHNTPTLQTQTDRQTDRQGSDSIGRIVLQTVAQNAMTYCRKRHTI